MSQPNTTDLFFQALASQPRRMILDLVKGMPGCSVNDICENFEMSRIGVMKHIKILVAANLIISRKQGRTRELFFNAAPIQMIYDRWSDEYSAFWTTQVVDLKYKIENQTQTKPNPTQDTVPCRPEEKPPLKSVKSSSTHPSSKSGTR